MHQLPSRNPVVTALYVNALLIAVLIGVLLGRDESPTLLPAALGQQQPQPIAGGGGLFLMPAQFSTNTWGCYVMDVDAQTLCAYQYVPGDKNLRFIAARGFQFDRQMKRFNTTPDPAQIRDMLKSDADPGRRTNENLEPASPEAPQQD